MIDWGRVVQLRDDVGATEFGPLLELFIDEIETVLAQLQAGDPVRLTDDLHFIRGSAVNLGFNELVSLCRQIETGPGQAPQALLDRLRGCYASSKKEFMRDLYAVLGDDLSRSSGVA